MAVIKEQFQSQQKAKKKKCVSLDSYAYVENQVDVSGVLKTTVVPSSIGDSGNRRSKRIRTVITHLSDLK